MSDAADIELPASFYLGREVDAATRQLKDGGPPVMLDARDLRTHGVVVGMTGSGKTGLCLSVLEEAAIDGIPCVVIDLKGDLCNLLLQFPNLLPADFRPWISEDEARSRGQTIEQVAEAAAEQARAGLADTLQSAERIARLRDSAEYRVYTPGSEAGLPLSVLQGFHAPGPDTPKEILTRKISGTASALLGLTGIDADPVNSPQHILIAQILQQAWQKHEGLSLAQLIQRVQNPPMRTVGAFDLDTFLPEKERLKLAVALNNLLASPSFSSWTEGEPLDFTQLFASAGKPRHLIFYLAHLDDAQRMFFLALLLDEFLAWTRRQQGSSSLRAMLYIDEVFGYLPPHPKNPPTKGPLLTLLKQARAFGVGVLLATQNPVDLDYKALSNAGVWAVGKLQTERDKARLLDGLESLGADSGAVSDRQSLDKLISGLGNRVFLLHDVHRPRPTVFRTRQSLCYLRGPMTLDQVSGLMAPLKNAPPTPAPMSPPKRIEASPAHVAAEPEPAWLDHPPITGEDLVTYYLPLTRPKIEGQAPVAALATADEGPKIVERSIVYRPHLLAFATVTFPDKKRDRELRREYRLLAVPPDDASGPAWGSALAIGDRVESAARPAAKFAPLPEAWNAPRKLAALKKEFGEFLYRSARAAVYANDRLGLVSELGEPQSDFLERCAAEAPIRADDAVAEAKKPFDARFAALASKLPVPPLAPQETLASRLWDLPIFSIFNTAPKVIQLGPPPADPAVSAVQAQLEKEQADWANTKAKLIRTWHEAVDDISEATLKPRKADVEVQKFGLAWMPFFRLKDEMGRVEFRPTGWKLG